jgi:hypothetical protein
MLLSEGDSVKYKNVVGIVTFMCDSSLSILVAKGQHRSHDVRVVVHKLDYNKVLKL